MQSLLSNTVTSRHGGSGNGRRGGIWKGGTGVHSWRKRDHVEEDLEVKTKTGKLLFCGFQMGMTSLDENIGEFVCSGKINVLK